MPSLRKIASISFCVLEFMQNYLSRVNNLWFTERQKYYAITVYGTAHVAEQLLPYKWSPAMQNTIGYQVGFQY